MEDEQKLQWISGIKTYPKQKTDSGQNVIFLTNRFLKIQKNMIVDINTINYRLFNFNACEITSGTACQ